MVEVIGLLNIFLEELVLFVIIFIIIGVIFIAVNLLIVGIICKNF